MMSELTIEQICVHEAGHAVACWGHGGKLELIAIGENSLISYSHDGFSSKFSYQDPISKEAVLIILSGLSAMLRIAEEPWNFEGCYRDLGGAQDLIKAQGWIEPANYNLDKFYRDFGGPSRIFCFSNWGLIKALSSELQIQKKMRGQAIAKFLEDNSPLGGPERALSWAEHEG